MAPRFLVESSEYDFCFTPPQASGGNPIDSTTSVSRLKQQFFEALAALGDIVRMDSSWSVADRRKICLLDDAMVVSFHEDPHPEVNCRLLQHSKGGFMLANEYLRGWTFRASTMSLVETQCQVDQLKKGLGAQCPPLGVFAQSLAKEYFHVPSANEQMAARAAYHLSDADLHLMYAGRLIAHKGLPQVVRAMNIWPLERARLTVIGSPEPAFYISQNGGTHVTFEQYFMREVVGRSAHLPVRIHSALSQGDLAKAYWSADAFVYPSIHEDEASGNAAYEAVLSGTAALVSDWSGLGHLGRNTRGGCVRTYPTLAGVRYSLKDLRTLIGAVAQRSVKINEAQKQDAEWVAVERDQLRMRNSIAAAVDELFRHQPAPPPDRGWHSRQLVSNWSSTGPAAFKEAIHKGGEQTPDGLLVDGTGIASDGWYSYPHLLQAVQAMHTTFQHTPPIDMSMRLRGFWRVALWEQEQAIVEFGFPGPRIKRYSEAAWRILRSSASLRQGMASELEFRSSNTESTRLLQELVELGYIVPDEFG